MTAGKNISGVSYNYTGRSLILLLAVAVFAMGSCKKMDDDQKGISGTLFFNAGENFNNVVIDVHYYLPRGDVSKMGFQVIMHDENRNGKQALLPWIDKAEEYRLVLVAPEFRSDYFDNRRYDEGNIIAGFGTLNPPEKTTFWLVDKIFEFVQEELDLSSSNYNIYGHSAGAEFIYRSLMFYNSPYVYKSIAANPGWYTYPDVTIDFPYGINNYCGDVINFRKRYHAKDMTILLGTADTLRNGTLRITPQSDAQGLNRLERGNNHFNTNQHWAVSAGHPFLWHLHHAQDVGHDNSLMSKEAADYLYGGRR